jgi:hypothetical protein
MLEAREEVKTGIQHKKEDNIVDDKAHASRELQQKNAFTLTAHYVHLKRSWSRWLREPSAKKAHEVLCPTRTLTTVSYQVYRLIVTQQIPVNLLNFEVCEGRRFRPTHKAEACCKECRHASVGALRFKKKNIEMLKRSMSK